MRTLHQNRYEPKLSVISWNMSHGAHSVTRNRYWSVEKVPNIRITKGQLCTSDKMLISRTATSPTNCPSNSL